MPNLPSCLRIQTEILLRRDDAEGVGVAHSSPPALYTDDGISLVEHTELDGIHNAPLQATVNILLPWLSVKVWLLLGEIERVNAAVQVGVLEI